MALSSFSSLILKIKQIETCFINLILFNERKKEEEEEISIYLFIFINENCWWMELKTIDNK